MSIVHRHKRRTASGKTTTVRQYERDGEAAAERKREAWEAHAAERWTPPPRAETGEAPAANETWWDDDVPKPEAWTDNDGQVEHEGHVFKVNRASAVRPQGDYDFAEP